VRRGGGVVDGVAAGRSASGGRHAEGGRAVHRRRGGRIRSMGAGWRCRRWDRRSV
jgi:hypothetical protein